MAANVVAAMAAIEQVTPSQNHQPLVKIKIQALNKGLSLLARVHRLSVTILHTNPKTPCYPRLR